MRRTRYFAIAILLVAAVSGCKLLDPVSQAAKRNPEIVLTAFLRAGTAVDSVVLTRTIPIDAYYSFMPLDSFRVAGATVVITTGGVQHTLVESAPGIYGKPSLMVQSGAHYAIDVTFPSTHAFAGRHLTAETTVPSPIAVDHKLDPSLEADGAKIDDLLFPRKLANPSKFGEMSRIAPFEVRWTATPGAAGYIVVSTAKDTSGAGILRQRDWENWLDGDFKDPVARHFSQNIGHVNLPDSLASDIFWAQFVYRGWYDVSVMAADEAYYDYFRTMSQGAGQSGSDVDEGVATNVTGGLGVFGSFTADTVKAFVKPEWVPSGSP